MVHKGYPHGEGVGQVGNCGRGLGKRRGFADICISAEKRVKITHENGKKRPKIVSFRQNTQFVQLPSILTCQFSYTFMEHSSKTGNLCFFCRRPLWIALCPCTTMLTLKVAIAHQVAWNNLLLWQSQPPSGHHRRHHNELNLHPPYSTSKHR